MKFSRSWLADFVTPPAAADELARVLTSIGHAVEAVTPHGDDLVLDVDVTSNRPDVMNHRGLARDLAVKLGTPLVDNLPDVGAPGGAAAGQATVIVEEPLACPRYTAHLVRGVTVGPSPAWLRSRLEAIGARSINNVVDVTNYVMWELGQPIHAFDLATIPGGEVRVRMARPGESLVTLDGVTRKLDPEILVIADHTRAIALGGIMGGRDTEVTTTTRDVLLESAHFAKARVRSGAKRLGMHTDASHRFERGADPLACAVAGRRAAELLVEVAGGTLVAGHLDARAGEHLFVSPEGRLAAKPTIELVQPKLVRFAGVAIAADETARILDGLGCQLVSRDGGAVAPGPSPGSAAEIDDATASWTVTPPSWRWYDIELAADLYEEVLRIVGFDQIPATLPTLAGPDVEPRGEYRLAARLRDLLAASGFAEAINYAFQSPEAARSLASLGEDQGSGTADNALPAAAAAATFLMLANPLSERHSTLRRSLLPGLIESARFNQRRDAAAVRLFELGHIFHGEELEVVAVVMGGRVGTPWERAVDFDVFDLLGVVDLIAEVTGVPLRREPSEREGMVAGRAALLRRVDTGELVGHVGELAASDLVYPLYGLELLTAPLLGGGGGAAVGRVNPPSRFPGIAVDLTITHALEVSWAALAAAITTAGRNELVRFGLVDRYRGKGVPEGAVNTTIAFFYNAEERSLTQEEVNGWHQTLAAVLVEHFGWSAASAAAPPELS